MIKQAMAYGEIKWIVMLGARKKIPIH